MAEPAVRKMKTGSQVAKFDNTLILRVNLAGTNLMTEELTMSFRVRSTPIWMR
jgi:hypothetical protein